MSSIICLWARESALPIELADEMFNLSNKRGGSGVGICLISAENQEQNLKYSAYRFFGKYGEKHSIYDMPDFNLMEEAGNYLRKDYLLLGYNSSIRETEIEIDPKRLAETMQPIIYQEDGLALVHDGSISTHIVKEMNKYSIEKLGKQRKTELESEAIIQAYLRFDRNIKLTCEYLVGGFSFILYDSTKKKLYAATSHNPLYMSYLRGYGVFFHTLEEGVKMPLSRLKGTTIDRCTVNVWEDWYYHQPQEFTIFEIDLDSGMCNEIKFEPRYITDTFDWYNKPVDETKVMLVLTSGGLDSSTSLALAKKEGFEPIALHFRYGHRGQDAEELGIRNVTEILGVKLVVFDIEQQLRMLDSNSMLINKDSGVLTADEDWIKTTSAWVIYRNHFFLTYAAAFAEKLIMERNLKEVYLAGGFMQLTESGVYPDNSERFLNSALQFFRFSITGTRLKPYYGFCNLTKRDEYKALEEMGLLEKLTPWFVSCDRPIVGTIIDENGKEITVPLNCWDPDKNAPGCGSGLLSRWAAHKAGVPDLRRYYNIKTLKPIKVEQ